MTIAYLFMGIRQKLTEGDKCVVVAERNSNVNSNIQIINENFIEKIGICLLASKCQIVVSEFKQFGRLPNICSFGPGHELIVCCPITSSIAKKRISKQKCDLYSKLTLHSTSVISLNLNPIRKRIDLPICNHYDGLIIGGNIAKPNEFPHMVAIGWTSTNKFTINYNCAGSLISEQFILTAAHCTLVNDRSPDIIRIGSNYLSDVHNVQPGQHFRIKNIIKHPDYQYSSYYNDIALIEINGYVNFTKYIRPACLAQSYNSGSGGIGKVIATGWGVTQQYGRKSNQLNKVYLNSINNTYCNRYYFKGTHKLENGIIDSQLCAGYELGGKDTCQGDSGGPLQIVPASNKCTFNIIGITSFGRTCGSRNDYAVYTRVFSYLNWIESIVYIS